MLTFLLLVFFIYVAIYNKRLVIIVYIRPDALMPSFRCSDGILKSRDISIKMLLVHDV